jgi:F-type H+-transporting ATPase subunit delta
VANVLATISERAEAMLARAGDAVGRVAEEIPAFAALLRAEPRLRAALTDISIGSEGKRGLLRSLLEERVDPHTLEVVGVLVEELLSPEQLERAAEDFAVRGILAAADAEGTLEDVEDELFRFARVIDSEPGLRSALTDPVIPSEAKSDLVRDLIESRARPATLRLVEMMLSSGSLRDPASALLDIAEMAARRRGRVVVEARTAVPIDVQRQARLAEALSRTLGRHIDLEVVVDPAVVGGVVARFGDELIDGSVKRKLELALEQLTA